MIPPFLLETLQLVHNRPWSFSLPLAQDQPDPTRPDLTRDPARATHCERKPGSRRVYCRCSRSVHVSEQQAGGAAGGPAAVWAAGAEAGSGSEVAGCGASLGPAESQTGGGRYRGRPAGAALHLSLTLAERRSSQRLHFDPAVIRFTLLQSVGCIHTIFTTFTPLNSSQFSFIFILPCINRRLGALVVCLLI